jgi:hypothetical protein
VKAVVEAGVLADVNSLKVSILLMFDEKLREVGENEAVTPEGRAVVMDKVTVLLLGLPPSPTVTI